VQEPGEADVRGVLAQLVAERLVGLHLGAVRAQALLRALLGGAALALGLAQDPAEQAGLERAPGDHPHAVLEARGQDLQLHGALQQVVERLLAGQAGEVARLRRLLRLGDVPAREVRRADVEDLALGDQGLHRLPDLVPRGVPVHVVHLVQVDVVGLEALEGRIARTADAQRRQVSLVGPFAHLLVDLGGDHGPVAAPAALREPAPDDLLGQALAGMPAVDVGGVEEVHALLVGAVHDREGVLLRGLRAEVHGAEAQPAHGQPGAAEVRVLHRSSWKRRRPTIL
jgi:hypothetical protein